MQFNRLRQNVQITLQQHMQKFGYQLVDTPVIDSAEIFLTKAGDQLISKLFTFDRYGKQLTLRPEFTAGATQRYVHEIKQGVMRWQFSGATFQDDPLRADHSYQRLSAGAELIGMDSPAAEAEIIAMCGTGLHKLGLHDYQLSIGHVGLLRQLIRQYDLDIRTERFLLNNRHLLHDRVAGKQQLLAKFERLAYRQESNSESDPGKAHAGPTGNMLDVFFDNRKLSNTMGGRTREDVLRRLLQKQKRADEIHQFQAAVKFLENWCQIEGNTSIGFAAIKAIIDDNETGRDILEKWITVVELIKAYGIAESQIRIQPELARSWDYYTGIVFEIKSENGQLLGAGGCYDELAQLMGGAEPIPAVGFAYYLDEILTLLPQPEATNILSVIANPKSALAAVYWATKLRAHEINTILSLEDVENPGQFALQIEADGAVRFQGRAYSEVEADLLIEHVNEMIR